MSKPTLPGRCRSSQSIACLLLAGFMCMQGHAFAQAAPATPAEERVELAEQKAAQAFQAYQEERFSEAVALYIDAYNAAPSADILYNVARIYDLYAKGNIFDRVPYVMDGAVKAIIAQQVDPRLSADLKAYDFHKVIDNGAVARLVKEGYFQSLFGPGIKAEESRKAGQAYK